MKINDHRQWLYNHKTGEGRIFEKNEEIHDGWYDSPDKANGMPMWGEEEKRDIRSMKKEELIELAKEKGIEIDPDEKWFTTKSKVLKELGE